MIITISKQKKSTKVYSLKKPQKILSGPSLLTTILNSIQDMTVGNKFGILQAYRTMERWYSHVMPLVGKWRYWTPQVGEAGISRPVPVTMV